MLAPSPIYLLIQVNGDRHLNFILAGTERDGQRCRYLALLAVENLAVIEPLPNMQMKFGR